MSSQDDQGKDELVFVALGGLGQVGMNAYLYGYGPPDARRWLMVDVGLTFPGEHEPGVDVILPDLRFIEAERQSLDGIVITHAHEDHIGALIESWPELRAPVYATPFTAGMLKAKLAEFGGGVEIDLREVPVGSRFDVGPFDVELIAMSHSIPETSGLAIRTPGALTFHTSDWKFDEDPLVGKSTDMKRLVEIGEEGVTTLVCDSTNAFRDGASPSEAEVAASLSKIIAEQPKQVAITTFASNVARIRAAYDAAKANGRRLVVAGRALHRVIQVAKDTGYLPDNFNYLDMEHYSYLEQGEALALVTGSQGEPRAAMARISEDTHRDIKLHRGDTVIYSSRTIPGNEKSILAVQNRLAEIGCKVITDADDLVHVTGHPRREELARMFDILKPKALVPMHGEVRHLRENARLAKQAGISDVQDVVNGQMLKLTPGPLKVVDEAPVGRLYRDGRLILSEGDGIVRERRRLAIVGVIAVAFAMDTRGSVLGDIEVELDGVPDATIEGDAMEDVVIDAVDGTIDSIPPRRRRDIEIVREAVRRSVRSAVDREWGKKTVVKVLISQLRAAGKGG